MAHISANGADPNNFLDILPLPDHVPAISTSKACYFEKKYVDWCFEVSFAFFGIRVSPVFLDTILAAVLVKTLWNFAGSYAPGWNRDH